LESLSKTLAPIILFVYNRPLYTQRVLDSLASNPEAAESLLYVYCDGAKKQASDEVVKLIRSTRQVVKNEQRFKKVIIIEQTDNKGLANSVVAGVTEVCNKHKRVIVLEDDIVTSPFFLRYMNDALQTYNDIDEVTNICGYWYPVKEELPETFFLKTPSCWGWATWEKAWNNYETNGTKLLSELKRRKLQKNFNLNGAINYIGILEDQIAGKNDSWAIKWDAVNFINNKMSLYPGKSLVQNIGFEGNGTHSGSSSYYDVCLADRSITVSVLPVAECSKASKALIRFYKNINRDILIKRIYKLVPFIEPAGFKNI